MHHPVQCAEGVHGGAERLFVDHPGLRGEPVPAKAAGEGLERGGRHGEVMHPLRAPAQLAFRIGQDLQQAPRMVRGEAATGEAQSGAELLPGTLVGLRAKLGQRVIHPSLKLPVAQCATAVADQTPVRRQQIGLGEAEKSREHHPASEVSGGTVEHEHDGVGHATQLGHGPREVFSPHRPTLGEFLRYTGGRPSASSTRAGISISATPAPRSRSMAVERS